MLLCGVLGFIFLCMELEDWHTNSQHPECAAATTCGNCTALPACHFCAGTCSATCSTGFYGRGGYSRLGGPDEGCGFHACWGVGVGWGWWPFMLMFWCCPFGYYGYGYSGYGYSYYGYGHHRWLQAAQADADVPLNA